MGEIRANLIASCAAVALLAVAFLAFVTADTESHIASGVDKTMAQIKQDSDGITAGAKDVLESAGAAIQYGVDPALVGAQQVVADAHLTVKDSDTALRAATESALQVLDSANQTVTSAQDTVNAATSLVSGLQAPAQRLVNDSDAAVREASPEVVKTLNDARFTLSEAGRTMDYVRQQTPAYLDTGKAIEGHIGAMTDLATAAVQHYVTETGRQCGFVRRVFGICGLVK